MENLDFPSWWLPSAFAANLPKRYLGCQRRPHICICDKVFSVPLTFFLSVHSLLRSREKRKPLIFTRVTQQAADAACAGKVSPVTFYSISALQVIDHTQTQEAKCINNRREWAETTRHIHTTKTVFKRFSKGWKPLQKYLKWDIWGIFRTILFFSERCTLAGGLPREAKAILLPIKANSFSWRIHRYFEFEFLAPNHKFHPI